MQWLYRNRNLKLDDCKWAIWFLEGCEGAEEFCPLDEGARDMQGIAILNCCQSRLNFASISSKAARFSHHSWGQGIRNEWAVQQMSARRTNCNTLNDNSFFLKLETVQKTWQNLIPFIFQTKRKGYLKSWKQNIFTTELRINFREIRIKWITHIRLPKHKLTHLFYFSYVICKNFLLFGIWLNEAPKTNSQSYQQQ